MERLGHLSNAADAARHLSGPIVEATIGALRATLGDEAAQQQAKPWAEERKWVQTRAARQSWCAGQYAGHVERQSAGEEKHKQSVDPANDDAVEHTEHLRQDPWAGKRAVVPAPDRMGDAACGPVGGLLCQSRGQAG